MSSADYLTRFGGIARLYGEKAFRYFRDMHFCVVGAGGVGSWMIEALARTGIGALTIIDYDTIGHSNINRQIHATDATIDRKKTRVMAERVGQINPECRCHVIDDFINMENIREYLDPGRGYDYVLDAIDSIKFKAAMIHHCRRNKMAILMTGAAGGLTDPRTIQIRDLSRTYNDPLAARVRAHLRDYYSFTRNPKRYFGIECVFSSQQQVYPKPGGTVGYEKPGIHGVDLDCNFGYGSASFVTATFGFVAVSRAIEKTLARKDRARNSGPPSA